MAINVYGVLGLVTPDACHIATECLPINQKFAVANHILVFIVCATLQ